MTENAEHHTKPGNALGTLAIVALVIVDLGVIVLSMALTFLAPLLSVVYMGEAALMALFLPHQFKKASKARGGSAPVWSRVLLFTAVVGLLLTVFFHFFKSAEPENLASSNLAALAGFYFLMSLIRWSGTLVFLYPVAAWTLAKGPEQSKTPTLFALALNTLSLLLLYLLERDFLADWVLGIGGFWALILPLGAAFGFSVGAYFVWLTTPNK